MQILLFRQGGFLVEVLLVNATARSQTAATLRFLEQCKTLWIKVKFWPVVVLRFERFSESVFACSVDYSNAFDTIQHL